MRKGLLTVEFLANWRKVRSDRLTLAKIQISHMNIRTKSIFAMLTGCFSRMQMFQDIVKWRPQETASARINGEITEGQNYC